MALERNFIESLPGATEYSSSSSKYIPWKQKRPDPVSRALIRSCWLPCAGVIRQDAQTGCARKVRQPGSPWSAVPRFRMSRSTRRRLSSTRFRRGAQSHNSNPEEIRAFAAEYALRYGMTPISLDAARPKKPRSAASAGSKGYGMWFPQSPELFNCRAL